MSERTAYPEQLFGSAGRARMVHPAGFDDELSLYQAGELMRRALNCVDGRLVDHGLRVATVLDAMLEADGTLDEPTRRAAYFLALMHDIGAYRTEEIDRLVEFETDEVWEHSFYGFLFFKELSPLTPYAEIVLYHHMPDDAFTDQDPLIRFLSQALQVADRVDVMLFDDAEAGLEDVLRRFGEARPGQFAPGAVALFEEAQRRFDVLGRLRAGVEEPNPLHVVDDPAGTGSSASFLDMLVHAIDFRSRHTVTHTVTTAWVAYELACRLLGDEAEAARVYCGALLHDVGKIGVPLSVLEKPGRLDADEMAVMRRHVELTEDILRGLVADDVLHIAVRHHEKLDGSGYPRGLCAGDLSSAERIVAVADIVSALVGTRSYKEAYPKEKVLALLGEQADRGLIDADVVSTVTRDYEAIMRSVKRASKPVADAYRRVQEEYAWLVEQLDEKTRARYERKGA